MKWLTERLGLSFYHTKQVTRLASLVVCCVLLVAKYCDICRPPQFATRVPASPSRRRYVCARALIDARCVPNPLLCSCSQLDSSIVNREKLIIQHFKSRG